MSHHSQIVIWSPENGHHEDYYLDLVEDV